MNDNTLDPHDWEAARALGHRMIDDAIGYLRSVRDRAVWTPIPDEVKQTFQTPLPQAPEPGIPPPGGRHTRQRRLHGQPHGPCGRARARP